MGSGTLAQRAVLLPARSELDACVPHDSLYFCAGDQTGESLTVLWLTVLAGLRVSLCCPLPSGFMT